jgi:hypothetical protein
MLSSTACPDYSGKSRLSGKTLLLTLFFFLLVTQLCFAQWFWQNPLPQGNTLNAVDFVSPSIGWAVGYYGTILRTTDGGTTWNSQTSGTTDNLRLLVVGKILYGILME